MPGIPLTEAGIPQPDVTARSDVSLSQADVETGTILWLGSLEGTLASLKRRTGFTCDPVVIMPHGAAMNRDAYNHPIVVARKEDNYIAFYIITTRGGVTELEGRFEVYIPVAPAIAQSQGPYSTLRLEDGKVMEKPGWIDVGIRYQMDWNDAQFYWAHKQAPKTKWRLDADGRRMLQGYPEHLRSLGWKSHLTSRRPVGRCDFLQMLPLEPGTGPAWRQRGMTAARSASQTNSPSLTSAPLPQTEGNAGREEPPASDRPAVDPDAETTRSENQTSTSRPARQYYLPPARSSLPTGEMAWRVNASSTVTTSTSQARPRPPDIRATQRFWRAPRNPAWVRLHGPVRGEDEERAEVASREAARDKLFESGSEGEAHSAP